MRNIQILLAASLLAFALTGCRAFVDYAIGEPVSPPQTQSAPVTSVPPTLPPAPSVANLAVSNLALTGGAVNCTDRTSIVFTITNTGSATAPESVIKLAMFS